VQSGTSTDETQMEFISGNADDEHKNSVRTSSRPKRTLITKNDNFLGNVHIKNRVVDVSVRSGNCVRCKQNCVYKQNDICDKNTSEVQKFNVVIDTEDKCKRLRPRNVACKHNINNTTIGYKNHDLSLPHK
jgi:hypothetical protein